jgi:mRNA-degrading endonuclease RelE of RelBE toxin-antitoxin system
MKLHYNIKTTSIFEKQYKKLIKKYKSLKEELAELILSLEENPTQGIPLSNHCFKIRISIKSKGKEKSGGARIITHFFVTDGIVFLLTIYDKSEKDSVTDKELIEILNSIE